MKDKNSNQYHNTLVQKIRNIPTGVLLTAEFIKAEFGPILSTLKLSEILEVKEDTIKQAISRRTFDIPVSKLGKKHVATAFDVAMYIEQNKVR